VRRRNITVGVAAIVLSLVPTLALGGSVTFTDPDDFEVSPDVHSTTKLTFLDQELGRRVRMSVRGELGPDFRLRVYVDSRRGDRADFVMILDMRDFDVTSCLVRRLFGEVVESRCGGNIDRVWWGVARRDLEPDKMIRWRVVGFSWPNYDTVSDRAPDSGWYP
jgi:hypothetical protein